MPKWGFAVVEAETAKDGETPDQKLKAFQRLQTEIREKEGRGVTATFGGDRQDAIVWPKSARIVEVRPLRRLYGYPLVTEFDLYIQVTADTERELTQAFKFLDRHCSVEGYTG